MSAIHKGESLTDKVDTGFLWKLAALDAAAAKAGKSVAKLLEGGAAVKPQHLQTARKPARLHTGQAFSLPQTGDEQAKTPAPPGIRRKAHCKALRQGIF